MTNNPRSELEKELDMQDEDPPDYYVPGTRRVHIKVFATRTHQFRAVVKPEHGTPIEITVGGERWKEGVLSEYHGRILEKCRVLLAHLATNLIDAGGIVLKEWEVKA